jgi:hypothetical protein
MLAWELKAALGLDRSSVHAALLFLKRPGRIIKKTQVWRLLERCRAACACCRTHS